MVRLILMIRLWFICVAMRIRIKISSDESLKK